MRRLTVIVVLAFAGLGLVGCGGAVPAEPAVVAEALFPEAEALEAIGFGPLDLTAQPSPGPSVRPSGKADRRDAWRKRHGVKVLLHRDVLHGEAVVQTKEGTRTVVVQRGTVTAVTATGMTVRSADGFSLAWTFGSPLHVIEHRTTIQPNQIAVGAQVGVAGDKQGDQTQAHLVVVPAKK